MPGELTRTQLPLQGRHAVGVIDFNAVGSAAMTITIGGVDFVEADAADLPNGVWTNGASAADSATSLAAAINGDTRGTLTPAVSAAVSDLGDSVIVFCDEAGTAGNHAMASDDASATVDATMHGGVDAVGGTATQVVSQTVTAQDVLADEVNIMLPFTPVHFVVQFRDVNGVVRDAIPTCETAIVGNRIRVNFAGATDLVAGDVVSIVASAA